MKILAPESSAFFPDYANESGTCKNYRRRQSPAKPPAENQALRAAGRLRAVDRSLSLHAAGVSMSGADGIAADEAGVTACTVRRWRKAVQHVPAGQRLDRLLDGERPGRPRKDWSSTDEELWRLWCTDWCREEAPDAAAVYRRLGQIAAGRGWQLPTLEMFVRRTRRDISKPALERARNGALAAMDTVPCQTRTVEDLQPLEIVNGDGRRHDVIVELPSGRIGRPVVWTWQDVRTRKVLAWRAGETESADLVRTALHDLIVQWGVPDRVVVDSTRAASAKWMTGGQPNRRRWKSSSEELPSLLQLLEIDYRITAIDRDAAGRGKGRGRSKPVERAFRDLAAQIDKHPLLAGSYTGRSPVDRPETHRSSAAAWEDFLGVVERCISEHNARPFRRTEAAAGRSFNAVFDEEYGAAAIRRLAPEQAAILMLAAEPSKVDRSGCVRINAGRGAHLPGNRYHAEPLVDRAGERVSVRFDPADLHGAVQVYDMRGRWICSADCLHPTGFADAGAARDYERARKQRRRAAERELDAIRDMDRLTEELRGLPPAGEESRPEPGVIRLVTSPDTEIPDAKPSGKREFMAALCRYSKQSKRG